MNSPKPESAAEAAAAAPAMPRSAIGSASVPMEPAPIEGVAPEPKAGPEAFLALGAAEKRRHSSREGRRVGALEDLFGRSLGEDDLGVCGGGEEEGRGGEGRGELPGGGGRGGGAVGLGGVAWGEEKGEREKGEREREEKERRKSERKKKRFTVSRKEASEALAPRRDRRFCQNFDPVSIFFDRKCHPLSAITSRDTDDSTPWQARKRKKTSRGEGSASRFVLLPSTATNHDDDEDGRWTPSARRLGRNSAFFRLVSSLSRSLDRDQL